MKKIAVITDSGSNLKEGFVKEHKNLFVVPLMIVVDGKEFRDQIEIKANDVYAKLDTHSVKTSLPAASDLEDTLNKIKAEGYTDLLVINISSGLSGTFNSFRLLLENEKELKVSQFDTLTLGGGQAFIVEYALELIDQNKSVGEILPLLKTLRFKDSLAFYTINTLKYLKAGGRIGKVEGTIGDLLHIKPIVTVNEEGVYVTLSKAFGLKRSLLKMKTILLDEFKDDLIDLIIHYGNNEDVAKDLADKLKPVLNIRNLDLVQLTPVLGVHTGPDMIAYVARRIK
ncbi:DegV family protein [Hujiaoplasma nucleasis]|uniref:DegV family protein n=1 Tax=Hujiaoplasma nucleasis TaxID=2725268 RepID=A0A7L6N2X1_9MOLU|nr:DegV family protein [Hujiaoplasma nucleasis]QLY39802.1 DegV family protein [Hujiaoplasma nucleasis]